MILVLILTLTNLVALTLMGVDKHKAVHHRWRIPELHLFAAAILGGGLGAVLGMLLFHHKTKHLSFLIGLPLILLVQMALLIVLT